MKIQTDFLYCYSSPDYFDPIGAINDDTTNIEYIEAIERHFDFKELTTLELGCAGGRIVMDLAERGHDAYGIEGTPYPLQLGRPAWRQYYNSRLFTCDLSMPFQLLNENDEEMKFDVISHWEFLEHLPPICLNYFHARLYTHLKDDGVIFCAFSPWGPTLNRDRFSDDDPRKTHALEVQHHQSCYWREEWEELCWSKFFYCHDYSLEAKLRIDEDPSKGIYSYYVQLTRKNTPQVERLAKETITTYEKFIKEALKVVEQQQNTNMVKEEIYGEIKK